MPTGLSDYLSRNEHAWRLEKATGSYTRVVPTRQGWQGYSDHHSLANGLTVGRGCFQHRGAHTEAPTPFSCHLGLHIVLDAAYTLHSTGLGQAIDIGKAQVWRRQGNLGEVSDVWRGEGQTKIVKLDFSADLLARWGEDFDLPDWLSTDKQGDGLVKLHHFSQYKALMASAAQLLHQRVDTLADLLAIESMALSLCAVLLRLPEQASAQPRHKIDDAIDWIRQHHQSEITISMLARAIGLNECYLKQQFKAKTGMTIGKYVRALRMQQAMDLLLNQGFSLKETAYHIGYRDTAHFAKVFKDTFGYSASDIAKEA